MTCWGIGIMPLSYRLRHVRGVMSNHAAHVRWLTSCLGALVLLAIPYLPPPGPTSGAASAVASSVATRALRYSIVSLIASHRPSW
jgi:hypothetical protein